MNAYDDPDHPGNGPAYHTGKLCIECHERLAGTWWGPHWCQPCNARRIARIDASLALIAEKFEEAGKP